MTDADAARRSDPLAQADALLELHRPDDALRALAPLLASAASAPGLCRGALALLQLGRLDEALGMAEQAATVNPGNEWAHRLRALILLKKAKGARTRHRDELLASAAQSATEAVRLAPSLPAVHHTMASVYLARRKHWEATVSAERLTGLAPRAASTWVLRSAIELDKSNPSARTVAAKRAEEFARRALDLDPASAEAWNNLGASINKRGRWREASRAYAEAARLDPSLEQPRGNLRRPGWIIVRALTTLVLLPLALLPQGSGIYAAAYIGADVLTQPGMPLRRYGERIVNGFARRAAKSSTRSRVAQVLPLNYAALVTLIGPMAGYALGFHRTAGPVLVLTFLIGYSYLIFRGLRSKK
jgi:tetratricopeptide (TPR) repeat protein